MSAEEEDSGTIHEKTVPELVRAFRNADDGDFTFLIGAGASAPEPAEIPTAEKMIGQFQEKIRDEENLDIDKIEDWAIEVEDENDVEENKRYGFWFEKAYPTPRGRREKVQQLVTKSKPDETVDPPFGQIILASMMADGIVSHTFTPNFDDLLFDAFYNYSDERPLFIDHNAKAQRFNMSGSDPAIVKLHGDYLHYTQNTPTETEELKPRIRESFRQSVSEYGTIVIGYGGTDDSIMSVLEEAAFCEGGLFWCEWEDGDGIDERVKQLLRESENAYLVEIGGADSLLRTLWEDIERVQLPDPKRIMERAREHRDMIKRQKDIPEDRADTTSETKNNEVSGASRVWDARDLIADEDYEHAISILDQVIKNNDGGATAYGLRGLAKHNLDKYEPAIEDLDQAINLNPNDQIAYNNRGNAYNELGEYERAIEDYDKAIELDPEYAKAYNNRGNTYNELGEYERAIEDYDKAIELHLEYVSAYFGRASSYSELGKYERAIEDYDKAIELDPEYVIAYNSRGNAYRNLGEYERAMEDYDKAIELDPEYTYAYANRAESRLEMGAYELASDDAQEAYELADDTDEAAMSLLLILISEIVIDEAPDELEQEYREVCSEEFTTVWNFTELERWLSDTELDSEKEDHIRDLISLLKDHN